MAENFSDLKKETYIQVQEALRFPNKMNPNISTPKHIIIKMVKFKERILKGTKRRRESYIREFS